MKQTKRSIISHRIFKLSDLKKIASLFDERAKQAHSLGQRYSIEYKIYFSDNTSFESESPALLDDIYIGSKRPIKVIFDFYNLMAVRRLFFSVTHGEFSCDNEYWIRSDDSSWLNDNFIKLESLINAAEPQSFWFANHSTILYNIAALGIGCLGMLLLGKISFLVFSHMNADQFYSVVPRSSKLDAFHRYFAMHGYQALVGSWLWKWLAGWFWGTFPFCRWFLSAWPNIELDFGAEHYKSDKIRRKKIVLVFSLIILPIILSVIQDIFKK